MSETWHVRTLDTQTDVASEPTATRRSARSAIVFCLIGFLAGITFWHVIGFWGFITEVVLSGPSKAGTKSAQTTNAPSAQQNKTDDLQFGIVTGSINKATTPDHATTTTKPAAPTTTAELSNQKRALNCSDVALDRETGAIETNPCPSSWTEPGPANENGRQDLAQDLSAPTSQGTAKQARAPKAPPVKPQAPQAQSQVSDVPQETVDLKASDLGPSSVQEFAADIQAALNAQTTP